LQAILQLAQSSGIIGSKDVFKTAGIFAFSDFYQDHFYLPNNSILMLTNRRVLMLVVSGMNFAEVLHEKLYIPVGCSNELCAWKNYKISV
jgi:hypothetical protein